MNNLVQAHLEYLLDRVNKTSGECWEWRLSLDRDGYGWMKKYGFRKAHRFSYYIHNGEIPEGMLVCHTCDNPSCVNPEHLFLGTHKDNMDDKVRKGRGYRPYGKLNPQFGRAGSKNTNAKLTTGEFYLLKIMIGMGSKKTDLARYFGVHVKTIYNMNKREGY